MAIEKLRRFVGEIAALVDSGAGEAEGLEHGANALRELIRVDDWLPDAYAQPSVERYQQFLLYADARQRFSVVSFVWGPGQQTPIHDHTVWGLIGVLRGAELAAPYARSDDGTLRQTGDEVRLEAGDVEAVSPRIGDIHRVRNAYEDRTSISIHVYGANIGAVRRSTYSPDGLPKPFISGYSNETLPNLWDNGQGTATLMTSYPVRTYEDVREALLARREIALLDVREEDPHAQCHPLFAANLSFSKIELDAYTRLPRRDVPIVLFDAGEGLAERAADKLASLGYTQIALLAGGLDGWIRAGGEVFRDVNVPSKAFGEFVEARRHTPSLSAEAVDTLLKDGDDVVVLDARRFDEYQTMNIPGSVSVPGGELVLRARALAPNPETRVVVNCAGRTRSIIGAQSLVNAGLPNSVAALRNGTIGWTLAGQTLEHGSQRQFDFQAGLDDASLAVSRSASRALADRAGVNRIALAEAARWAADSSRTTYRFDVRTPAEYERAHAPGFQGAPGGQLVQETEMFAPVRGARIVLFDDDGVRANMTASWLAQMNIEVVVVDGATASDLTESGAWRSTKPEPVSTTPVVSADELAKLLADPASGALVIDVTSSANHVKAHIPGAYWIVRSRLVNAIDDLRALPDAKRYVLTCATSALAVFAAPEIAALTGKPVHVLEGGTSAWIRAGLPTESGSERLASPRIDRYRRPYEGTDNAREAMNAYLEWEYGLVAQLERDRTHGFFVI